MNTVDPEELLRYFSDFLTEINLIIRNIKHHTYQMVDVFIPNPSLIEVYQSMASIISSTHRTFDDLKRIESVMTGVVKSKRLLNLDQPHTTLPRKVKSKVQEIKFFYQIESPGDSKSRPAQSDAKNQVRTIKRSNIKQQLKRQVLISTKKEKDQLSKEDEDEKTIKYMTQRGSQSPSSRIKPLNNWKKIMQEKIEAIIRNNRSSLDKIMNKNTQCLRIVRSLKKQFHQHK